MLVAGDLVARAYAEGRLQQAVDRNSAADEHIKVHIHSFPFLWHLLVGQKVAEVDAKAPSLSEGPIDIHDVALKIKDLKIDRSQLLFHQKIQLKGMDTGTATATIGADDLTHALGLPVQLSDGAIEVTVLGQHLKANLAVSNGDVSVKVAGVQVPTIPLPGASLMPCRPNATVVANAVRLDCTVHGLPNVLRDLVNGAASPAGA